MKTIKLIFNQNTGEVLNIEVLPILLIGRTKSNSSCTYTV